MKNKEYWQKRFDLLQAQQLNKGIEFYHNLSEQYDKAAMSVQKEIEAFYQRFAKNNELKKDKIFLFLKEKKQKNFSKKYLRSRIFFFFKFFCLFFQKNKTTAG